MREKKRKPIFCILGIDLNLKVQLAITLFPQNLSDVLRKTTGDGHSN